jgi:UDP-2,4-diacetamido-2,4,6-trideoxy-beta-L-altropyranose hydrolase
MPAAGGAILARVVCMLAYAEGVSGAVSVRRATEADGSWLRELRNDSEVRSAFRNGAEVGEEDHAAWLAAVLADADRHLLVGERCGEAVGQVRFDRLGGRRYEISVSVTARARGSKLAAPLISQAIEWLREAAPGAEVEAHVRESNARSLAAFRRAGFRLTGERGEEGFVVLLAAPGGAGA